MPQEPRLLERLQESRDPVRLYRSTTRNGPTDTRADEHRADEPRADTFLGVPVYCDDEHVGNLCLSHEDDSPGFTAEDETIANMFASLAASIVANARRYEEARKAREDVETLMDLCPVALSVFDARAGSLAYMNQECRRKMEIVASAEGSLDDVFISTRFTRADGRELSFAELPGTRALLGGETVMAEEIVSHFSNGYTMTQSVSCIPVFSDTGDIVSVLTVSQDLAPLRDQELWRAEFLTMVSEELRTPLTSIKGSAASLIDEIDTATPAETLQWLHIIDQQADLMRGQINNLTELTQIETGTLSLTTAPTDVAALIRRSCDAYLSDHPAVTIRFAVPDGLSAAMADEEFIGKVLHNMLRDVAMYGADTSSITVSAEEIDIHVAVTISAKGSTAHPVRPAFRNNVTEAPELFDETTRALNRAFEFSYRGEGLAMSFCRGVIEAHGGRFRTDVDEPEGKLTLTFTLPTVEDADGMGMPGAGDMADDQQSGPGEKTQILVSIQDPRSQRTVRQVLFDAGYASVEAAGLDELENLASSEGPALIVLDIAGREDEAFHALRGAGNPRNLPAIVLCNRSDEDYVVQAFEMGADGYMVKPFSPSELIARIRATLRLLRANDDPDVERTYRSGDVRVNFDARTVAVAGESVPMTATEYKLLAELANGAGRVLTQDMLLQRVWGPEYLGESQLLRSFIKSLRQKLGDNARKPSYIFTEHGIGYRMAESDS